MRYDSPKIATSVCSMLRRVIAFVDNAGADIVLGMLPLARELLRMGSEVVLAANTQPAINDITAAELRAVVAAAVQDDPILRGAWDAGLLAEGNNRFRVRHNLLRNRSGSDTL